MKKYTDVDIVAELQKLVDSHVDSYKEDFDIDKRIILRAAESQNPEDKTLMWFCRPHGTHCLSENQVFIQGTRDHNTFRFYMKSVTLNDMDGEIAELMYKTVRKLEAMTDAEFEELYIMPDGMVDD